MDRRSASLLALVSMAAMSGGVEILNSRHFSPADKTGEPTEADKEKLAKAEAKRQRRAMRNQRNTK